jgi:hypothetical protein
MSAEEYVEITGNIIVHHPVKREAEVVELTGPRTETAVAA